MTKEQVLEQAAKEVDAASKGSFILTSVALKAMDLYTAPLREEIERLKAKILSFPTLTLHDPSEPPRRAQDAPEMSETVCIIDEDGLDGLGWYHYDDKKWFFHTDTLVDYYEPGHEMRWKWYYPPVKWAGLQEPIVQIE